MTGIHATCKESVRNCFKIVWNMKFRKDSGWMRLDDDSVGITSEKLTWPLGIWNLPMNLRNLICLSTFKSSIIQHLITFARAFKSCQKI